MTDHEAFEARLRAALARYVSDGPMDFDALEFARAVAVAEPRRHGPSIRFLWPTRRAHGPAWVLLAAALLVTALVAGALVVGSRRDPQPSLQPPDSGPLPLQTVDLQPVELPAPAGTIGRFTGVTASEPGYLAVGGGGSVGGLVWTSSDGLAWDLVSTGDTFADAELHAVVATEQGFVVVGHDLVGSSWRAAAWLSADGRDWRSAVAVLDPDDATMQDVAFANGRYVAVGWTLGRNLTPRIWVSDDGDDWAAATDFAAKPSFMGAMVGVAAGGPGFVTVGLEHGIWTSPDGDVWTRSSSAASDLNSPWPSVPRDVVAGSDGHVVVAGRGPVLESHDGLAWSTRSPMNVVDLAATSHGFVAIGTNGPRRVLWTSTDAETWVARLLDDDIRLGTCPECEGVLFAAGDVVLVSASGRTWSLPGPGAPTATP